jgi:hypothetical protein
MDHRVTRSTVWIRHSFREEHDVLVRIEIQVDLEGVVVLELERSQPRPTLQTVRDRDRRSGAERSECDVGHDVDVEGRHPRDAGIFDAPVLKAVLPRANRFQNYALPLHPGWYPINQDHARLSHA